MQLLLELLGRTQTAVDAFSALYGGTPQIINDMMGKLRRGPVKLLNAQWSLVGAKA